MVDIRSHVFNYEAGGISFHSQAAVYPVMPSNGEYITAEDVASRLILDVDVHYAPTRVISLENTLNGTIMPLTEIARIRALTLEHGIKLHLDGARLWHASVTTGISMEEYCSYFDTVSLCLSKGIGAPIGSILVGSDRTIKKARHFRLLFGGGWRQAGFLAEAALWCLKTNWESMVETHRQARWLARAFLQVGCQVTHPVETNMVWIDTTDAGFTVDELIAELAKEGIKMSGSGLAARVVLHYQISDMVLLRYMSVLKRMAKTPKMKVFVELTQAMMRQEPNSIYANDERPGTSPQSQLRALILDEHPKQQSQQQQSEREQQQDPLSESPMPPSPPTPQLSSLLSLTNPFPTPPQRIQSLRREESPVPTLIASTVPPSVPDSASAAISKPIPQRYESLNSKESLITRRVYKQHDNLSTTKVTPSPREQEPKEEQPQQDQSTRRHSVMGTMPNPRRLAFDAARRLSMHRDQPLSPNQFECTGAPQSSREARRSMQFPPTTRVSLSRPLSAYGLAMLTSEDNLLEEQFGEFEDEELPYWRGQHQEDARFLRRSQSLNLETDFLAQCEMISSDDHSDLTDEDDDGVVPGGTGGHLPVRPYNAAGTKAKSIMVPYPYGNKANRILQGGSKSNIESGASHALGHNQKKLQYRIAHNSASKALKRASNKIVRWGSLLTREP
ncbi:threonine aldolase [Entomortierella parvispora]|uniref:Threonine aldolase n=1 Tax=Entomortierella parvispora TaxID=205924 RepID=A0A9P3HAZ0_9FUNG|nr:threonine aldolase [Entomortierella parvispora]